MDWRKLKENKGGWQTFWFRAQVIDKIRAFFKKEGFLEVQTPSLSPSLVPESYLEIFETELRDKEGRKRAAFLTPSPELWHKKLLTADSGSIFEITKSFRNTDIGSPLHNPEFTLLEWYRTPADYLDTMADCEKLLRFLAGDKITYQGKDFDLVKPFERITVENAFAKYAPGADPFSLSSEDFSLIYVDKIEPNLGFPGPTIMYDYPAQFAPLAKTSKKDPRVKERFELYLSGIELADAYNELTDPIEQKEQFKKEAAERKKSGRTNHSVDWDFIEALKAGLSPCSGVALGIDRLLMILADKTDINEVILFGGKDIFPF